MAEAVTGIDWSEFGLSGVIIGALFWALIWLAKSIKDHLASERASHREERTEIIERFDNALQRNEERNTASNDKLAKSMDDIARALQNMTNRP